MIVNYRLNKIKEKLAFWVAWRMPRWLVYFCAVRLMSHATTGKYSNTIVPELGIIDALERWDTPAPTKEK